VTTLPFDKFEQAFERLAQAIDEAGPDQERLFLTKLALALTHQLSDFNQFEEAVTMALRDLPIDNSAAQRPAAQLAPVHLDV
jgi:hypothetical protein